MDDNQILTLLSSRVEEDREIAALFLLTGKRGRKSIREKAIEFFEKHGNNKINVRNKLAPTLKIRDCNTSIWTYYYHNKLALYLSDNGAVLVEHPHENHLGWKNKRI